MRTLRFILAVSVSLAAFSALRAEGNFGRQWMEHYYEQPRPDDVVHAVVSLDQAGYFAEGVAPDTAIGFFTVVFQQNPRSVERWLRTARPIVSDRAQRVLVLAAWLAGDPAATVQVRRMSAYNDRAEREAIGRMMARGTPPAIRDWPVDSEGAMNLQWGAFLASGNERYVTNVLAALGSDRPGLANSARFALAQNAMSHPSVLEICRQQLDRQPEAIRPALEAALSEATAASAKRPGA
jgi:hypothetical protein